MDLFTTLIIIHIAGGSMGLLGGTVAASVVKGKKVHLVAGKVFSIGMIIAAVSALIISNLPHHENLFLFAVGGFTLYMVSTGYRIVFIKRNQKNSDKVFGVLDYTLFVFGACFSLFLLVQSVKGVTGGQTFAIVPGVFGLICLNFIRMDIALMLGKKPVKQTWISNHITRMMGALIASYTAFLVVNVQLNTMQWALWLAPTLAGSVLIARFLRKFAPRKSAKAV